MLVIGAHSADFVWRAGGALAVTTANGGTEVDQMYIQKTVNVFAAAIHSTDPNAVVMGTGNPFAANCTTWRNLNQNAWRR